MTGSERRAPGRPSARGDDAAGPDQAHPGRAVLAPTDELRILLVEDDDADAILVEELLADGNLKVELHRATTLDGALEMVC